MYSSEQQLQIIETLHKCVEHNINRHFLSQKRLDSLKQLFEQQPALASLEPLLAVTGFGPRLILRICDSILHEAVDSSSSGRFTSHLITPLHVTQSVVDNVVSIHLGINTISWTRLRTTNPAHLDTMGLLDMSPSVENKYDAHSIWKLVMQLRDEVPDGDVYVMENCNWSNVANIKKPMKFHIKEAMINSAICSIFNATDSNGETRLDKENRVYYIRTYTPFRLFKKFIGSERVSAQDIVQNMVEGVQDERHQPLTFSDDALEQFFSVNGAQRDSICSALLTVISFAELILLRNPVALSIIGKSTMARKKASNAESGCKPA